MHRETDGHEIPVSPECGGFGVICTDHVEPFHSSASVPPGSWSLLTSVSGSRYEPTDIQIVDDAHDTAVSVASSGTGVLTVGVDATRHATPRAVAAVDRRPTITASTTQTRAARGTSTKSTLGRCEAPSRGSRAGGPGRPYISGAAERLSVSDRDRSDRHASTREADAPPLGAGLLLSVSGHASAFNGWRARLSAC